MSRLCLLLVGIVFLSNSIESAEPNNVANFESDTKFFELQGDKHREGFEVFFHLTNLFIDRVFMPVIPKELRSLLGSGEAISFDRLTEAYGLKSDDFIMLPFKIYPSLVVFTILTLVLAFIILFIGTTCCMYRCCCSTKPNPYDHKSDSLKRKIFAFFLFVILVAILITSVILFFTNQNSTYAINSMPSLLNSTFEDVKSFNENEMAEFFKVMSNNIEALGDRVGELKNDTTELFRRSFVITLMNSKMISDYNTTIEHIKQNVDENLRESLNNLFSINTLIDNVPSNTENNVFLTSFDKIFSSFSLNSQNYLNKIQNSSSFVLNTISDQILPTYPKYLKYYDYCYFTLMVVSVFMLFLFVLYAIGLTGICARRTQQHMKQSCHRSSLARLMLSGVGFYFIFSWLLLIVSVTLFVPGIAFRHMVCKPAIEIENNQIYQTILDVNKTSSFKFTKLLRECDQFNRSVELKQEFLKLTDFKNMVKNNVGNLDTKSIYSSSNAEINSFFNNLATSLEAFISNNQNQALDTLAPNITTLVESFKNNQNSENFFLFQTDTIKLAEANKIIVIGNVQSILNDRVDNVFDNSPSCRILSSTYKNLVRTGCYQYLDNFNTYWFTLLIAILLHFILVFFAIKQSDLYRKYYPYDGMSQEISSQEFQGSVKQSKHFKGLDDQTIDAFEMDGYPRYNYMKSKQDAYIRPNNVSPPPKYNN